MWKLEELKQILHLHQHHLYHKDIINHNKNNDIYIYHIFYNAYSKS